ncbi:hypothetical protein DFH06DRAFT_1480258 [Mycena polygramma]|nr:hypothetical protein DFH06DRAFT_1480258 [Mycena polygramma]
MQWMFFDLWESNMTGGASLTVCLPAGVRSAPHTLDPVAHRVRAATHCDGSRRVSPMPKSERVDEPERMADKVSRRRAQIIGALRNTLLAPKREKGGAGRQTLTRMALGRSGREDREPYIEADIKARLEMLRDEGLDAVLIDYDEFLGWGDFF